jgi:hypothetical protein
MITLSESEAGRTFLHLALFNGAITSGLGAPCQCTSVTAEISLAWTSDRPKCQFLFMRILLSLRRSLGPNRPIVDHQNLWSAPIQSQL